MVNVLKFKAKLKEMDLTQKELAKKIVMDPSTLNKKLNDKTGKYLNLKEAMQIKEVLHMSDSEVVLIFFDKKHEYSQAI